MRKLLFLPLLVVLVIVTIAVWFYINSQPVSNNRNFSYFVIPKGASASQIGNKLQNSGFIKSALAFKIYIQVTNQSGDLQTGEFRLTPSYSLFQTVDTLFKGMVEVWVTIPEGLRREEIATRFASGLNENGSFIDDFLQASKGKEGYLFPDTYLFPLDASPSSIVKKMLDTFTSKTQSLTSNGKNLSFTDTVIIASLLERETKTDAERQTVAGILIKRLIAGWPLQIDASVQYAVATGKCRMVSDKCKWWEPLVKEDLSLNSLYNTYKYSGLPPAPIANPGLSSLKAALNPIQSEYWYYIHDDQGQIHYAKNLEEQNDNIAKYLSK